MIPFREKHLKMLRLMYVDGERVVHVGAFQFNIFVSVMNGYFKLLNLIIFLT